MTREEAIHKLIKIRQLQGSKSEAHEALGMAIEALSQLSLPEGLEEAAFTYENDLWESGFKDCGYSPQEVNDAFKAGAKWQAEQGVTIKGMQYGGNLAIPDAIPESFYTDSVEEVIVQIRKKDE